MSAIFYPEINFLSSSADALGIPLDQVTYLICLLLTLILGIAFRIYCPASKVGISSRHLISAFIGCSIGFFYYGFDFLYLILQLVITYLILKLAPIEYMHILVFIFSISYLSFIHIYLMIYDYGGYSVGIDIPIMLSTQKFISLAFSIHDGLYKSKESLTADQNIQAIRKFPNVLEYLSFILNFQGLLAGPLCFYSDYISYIECRNFDINSNQITNGLKGKVTKEPNPFIEVLKKIFISLFFLFITCFIAPSYNIHDNYNPDFVTSSTFAYRIYFLMLSANFARAKYYFVWKFSEAINNAAGFGFNGYDENGNAKWDLITNIHIRKIFTATSSKVIIENWNVQCALWLRRICYDRAPKQYRTFITLTLSALWHGFYPGYYAFFCVATLYINTARVVRRNVRPYFQASSSMRFFYDIITWISTQMSSTYISVSFVFMELKPIIYFYTKSTYCFMHILVILTYLVARHIPSGIKS